ncbi:hypothetical protein AURDEDRAFT_142943 [Auricularia subglabra TFB-10046 SS5]|nr:hypothetical protein AURDEDRAFT_142943 [Auricularia subglabra TFB-10046 SS5]
MAQPKPNRDHQVWGKYYTSPCVAIDPTKDFRGRVQDVIDFLTVSPVLPAKDQREIATYTEAIIPPAVPESDAELMARRTEVLQYQVRDAGESLIDTGSRNANLQFDQYRCAYLLRLMNIYKVMRFALIFHDPRRSIRRLPRDILMLVFECVLEGTDEEDNLTWNETLSRLSMTCRSWKQMMLSRHGYWTRFSSLPRSQPFLPAQLRTLAQHPNARVQIDLALHPKAKPDMAHKSDSAQQMTDRVRSLLSQLSEALSPAVTIGSTTPTYFSRCVRLRVWATLHEWALIREAIKILRVSQAPELREIELSVLDLNRIQVDREPSTPYFGSMSLEILRMHRVANLWAWPTSPLQAPLHAQLRWLELHTLGNQMPRVRELHGILLGATQLQVLRLYASPLRRENSDAELPPVHLLQLRELGIQNIGDQDIRMLFKVIRCPHLKSLELRDLIYHCDQAEFLTQGTLMECAELDDLRLAAIKFVGVFDMRELVGHYPHLRHLQIEDVNPQVLLSMESAVLDEKLMPDLKYWRFDYPHDNMERDDRGAEFNRIFYEIRDRRPSIERVNAHTHQNMMKFGKPLPKYWEPPIPWHGL